MSAHQDNRSTPPAETGTSPTAVEDLGTVPFTFAVVGTQKSGTSTLMTMLHKHRQITRAPRKEQHVFDDETRDWNDPDLSDYRAPRRRPREVLAGDGTPAYLFWPGALERLRDHAPQMRLIAVFRDPIDRLFSNWMMLRERHPNSTRDWPDYIHHYRPAALPSSIPPEMKPVQFRRLTGVPRGYYGQQLERGLRLFPREQWLLLTFEDLIKNHGDVLSRATRHIGVDDYKTVPELAHRMANTPTGVGTPVTAEDLSALAALFADDLALFESLSDLDTSGWPTRRILAGTLDPAQHADRLSRKAELID